MLPTAVSPDKLRLLLAWLGSQAFVCQAGAAGLRLPALGAGEAAGLCLDAMNTGHPGVGGSIPQVLNGVGPGDRVFMAMANVRAGALG